MEKFDSRPIPASRRGDTPNVKRQYIPNSKLYPKHLHHVYRESNQQPRGATLIFYSALRTYAGIEGLFGFLLLEVALVTAWSDNTSIQM